MTDINQRFFTTFFASSTLRTVYTDNFPLKMKASEKDEDGWIEWKPLEGSIGNSEYNELEHQFGVVFPKSFIDWHKTFYFLDGDCSIIRLPSSNPDQPLYEIMKMLDWYIPEQLIPQKLYPFADEGNDTGPLVFDGRTPMPENEFPIRVYDFSYGGDLDGLSEIIFSSFPKMLECLTHFLSESKTKRDFEFIPDFLQLDPKGAGNTGIDFWLSLTGMRKENYELFKE